MVDESTPPGKIDPSQPRASQSLHRDPAALRPLLAQFTSNLDGLPSDGKTRVLALLDQSDVLDAAIRAAFARRAGPL